MLVLFCNYMIAQNFNKEKEHLIALSNDKSKHIYVEFLKEFGFNQEIGLGDNVATYNEYKKECKLDKNGQVKLKKNPFFTTMEYEENSYRIIKSIQLYFKSAMSNSIKEKLVCLCGQPTERNTYSMFFYIPNKYYIMLFTSSDISYLKISALDFMLNTSKYDEFAKVGMVYFDQTPTFNPNKSSSNHLYFVYAYDKKKNSKGFAIRNKYISDDWLFINEIQFRLADDDNILSIEVTPTRQITQAVFSTGCVESAIGVISPEFIDKILNSSKVKVKVSGDKGSFVFELSSLHKYQILTAKEYYNNDIL